MFEQEIEMERKEGSSFGPVIVILLLVGLFVGGLGVVIYQGKQKPKPEQATAAVQTKLKNTDPVTVTFHTGNVSYYAADNPTDPHYMLLDKAGIIKITKTKGTTAKVELTPAGKDLLASLDVKGVPKNDTVAYTLPLASRKLVAIGNMTRLNQEAFQVQYTWAWQTTKAGELFDIAGKYVQGLPSYQRSMLIDQHGAKYYHSEPSQAFIVLIKGDHGWELAPHS